MKKFVLIVTTLILALALCACSSGGSTGTTPAPSESKQVSTSEPTQEQAGQGDIIDDPVPAGADDVIMQGVFYYELAEMPGDYGDGLSPREGAGLANDLLMDMGFYSGNSIPDGQCVFISFDELTVLDSAMGRECYIYSVGLGTAESGLMGDDYQVIYRISVDYSGEKTAAIYDDFSSEGDDGEGRGDLIQNQNYYLDSENMVEIYFPDAFLPESVSGENDDGKYVYFQTEPGETARDFTRLYYSCTDSPPDLSIYALSEPVTDLGDGSVIGKTEYEAHLWITDPELFFGIESSRQYVHIEIACEADSQDDADFWFARLKEGAVAILSANGLDS